MMSLLQLIPLKICFFFALVLCTSCTSKLNFLQEKQIQLASPIIESDSVFFAKDLEVNLHLGLDDVDIRYTLDNSEPTVSSSLFSEGVILTKSIILKARAFHSDYLPSETVSTQFIRTNSSMSMKKISLNREAHKNYKSGGLSNLIDNIKGTKDFKSDAWLGFAGGDLEIVLEYTKKEEISQVIVSLLSDQNSWIFLPNDIEVYTANRGGAYSLTGIRSIEGTKENSQSEFRFLKVDFVPQKADHVKVILKNISEIPAWHPGKGTPPWLFVDEILVK